MLGYDTLQDLIKFGPVLFDLIV